MPRSADPFLFTFKFFFPFCNCFCSRKSPQMGIIVFISGNRALFNASMDEQTLIKEPTKRTEKLLITFTHYVPHLFYRVRMCIFLRIEPSSHILRAIVQPDMIVFIRKWDILRGNCTQSWKLNSTKQAKIVRHFL